MWRHVVTEVIGPSEEKRVHNLGTRWRRMVSRFISDESAPHIYWIGDSVDLREGLLCVGRWLVVDEFLLLRPCWSVQFITVTRWCASYRLASFRTYVYASQPLYAKLSAQIHRYYAECVFELLYPNDQQLTLDRPVEIRKQSAPWRSEGTSALA